MPYQPFFACGFVPASLVRTNGVRNSVSRIGDVLLCESRNDSLSGYGIKRYLTSVIAALLLALSPSRRRRLSIRPLFNLARARLRVLFLTKRASMSVPKILARGVTAQRMMAQQLLQQRRPRPETFCTSRRARLLIELVLRSLSLVRFRLTAAPLSVLTLALL